MQFVYVSLLNASANLRTYRGGDDDDDGDDGDDDDDDDDGWLYHCLTP